MYSDDVRLHFERNYGNNPELPQRVLVTKDADELYRAGGRIRNNRSVVASYAEGKMLLATSLARTMLVSLVHEANFYELKVMADNAS